MHIRIRKDEG